MEKKLPETADEEAISLADVLAVFRDQHERAHAILGQMQGQDTADLKTLTQAVNTMGAIGQRLFLSALHMAEALGARSKDGHARGPGFEVAPMPKD